MKTFDYGRNSSSAGNGPAGLEEGGLFLGVLQEAFGHFQEGGKRLTEARLKGYIRANYPHLEKQITEDRAAWEGSLRARGMALKPREASIRPEGAYVKYVRSGSQSSFAEWLRAKHPAMLAAAARKLEVFKRRASRRVAARETRTV